MTAPDFWPVVTMPQKDEPGSKDAETAIAPMETTFMQGVAGLASVVERSLVTVTFTLPYTLSGIQLTSFIGTGVVIDADRGLVLVDRNTIPASIGDVFVIIAGSVEVPGKIEFLHPLFNFSVVSYDPALIGSTPVRSMELSPTQLKVGSQTVYVGMSRRNNIMIQTCTVVRSEPFAIGELPTPPRFRSTNIEVLTFDRVSSGMGGLFVDQEGRMQAYWASFSYQSNGKEREIFRGIPSDMYRWTVEALRQGKDPVVNLSRV